MLKNIVAPSGETKPGLFTTEFILTFLVNLAIFCSALGDVLPAKWAALASSISVGAYAFARGLAKERIAPTIPYNTTAAPPTTVVK